MKLRAEQVISGSTGSQPGRWKPVISARWQEALRQIIYTRTENGDVKPAFFLRLIFRKGVLENRSWRGVMMFITVLLGMGFLLLWVLASIWSLSAIEQALTLRQLLSSGLVVFLAWITWRAVHQPWVELVDNRVVKAPAPSLALKEDSAELEMYRDDAKRPLDKVRALLK